MRKAVILLPTETRSARTTTSSSTSRYPFREANQRLIDSAVEVARQADFVIVAVGENELLSRESTLSSYGKSRPNNRPPSSISTTTASASSSNRDSRIVYSLAEVTRERRDGYGWYTYEPRRVLNAYPAWWTNGVDPERWERLRK